jgi:branched-chain amino acid transport system substrate-binding protein
MKKFLGALVVGGAALAAFAGAHAADKVKIGFLTTLTGAVAVDGVEARDGFMLAVKHANGKLGGLPTEVIVLDDQQKPDVAAQNVERLIQRDKVDFMTGILVSNVALPVMPRILESGTIYLSSNTGPADYAGEKCNPSFFAVAWQNEDVPGGMGMFMSDKKIDDVLLIAPNYPGGRETLAGFKRYFKGKITDEIYVKLGQLDYATEIGAIRAAKPKGVFFFLGGGMGINFVKQYVAAGLNREIPLYTPGFVADEDILRAVGESMIGAYNTSFWALGLDNASNKRFVADFQKDYGRRPSMYAAQAYDVGLLLDAAIKKVGGNLEDKKALQRAIHTVEWPSVRGKFKFNTNNYPIHDIYLRQVVKNDQGQILNRLVGKVATDFSDPFAAKCPMKW